MEHEERLKAALADRYLIEREIGSGGMATVYLATDIRHDRKVAVKVLRSDLAASLGTERFLQEVRVTANLTHPHILPLHDSGEADGFLYYVMPYIEGESLRERLVRERELPVPEAARLLRDVVDALAAAHKLGVVHRDIKPENVLISGRHAMVADFGVAKAVSEATGRHKLTTLGVALGTPSYMAPEQAAADEAIDHRADIYAVGAMAYELLTGRPPFTGGTPQQILAAQVMETPQPVTGLRASVPPALETLIMRCLEKKPADRWQSAEEMLPPLEAAAMPSGGATPMALLPERRRRFRWLGAVAAVFVFIPVAAYFAFFGDTETSANKALVAVFPFENRTGDPALAHLGPLAADMVAEGLGWITELRVIATDDLERVLQAQPEDASVTDVALALGAFGAVTGQYTKEGDELFFRAQVLLMPTGDRLGQTQASAPLSSPMPALTELQDRVAGGVLAAAWGIDDSSLRQLPTYAAAEASRNAGVRFGMEDWAKAASGYVEAYQLDTTFLSVLPLAIEANKNMGRWSAVDSLLHIVLARRAELSTVVSLLVERQAAEARGDLEDAMELDEARGHAQPDFWPWAQHLAESSLRAGYPARTLDALARINPSSSASRREPYWIHLAAANAWVGRYSDALEAARDGRARVSQSLALRDLEAQALIALDRPDEIEPLLVEIEELQSTGSLSPGHALTNIAANLARYGHLDEARTTAGRAIEWFRLRDRETHAQGTSQALLIAGQSAEALIHLGPLAEEHPDSLDIQGLYGIALAEGGHTAGAQAVVTWFEELDPPYLFGADESWRAAILVHLGQREDAVRLLRQAYEEGRSLWIIREDVNLLPLWGYEPFEEFVRPRG